MFGQSGIFSSAFMVLLFTQTHPYSHVPVENTILEYRTKLTASLPSFLLPRRFVAAESWTKAVTDGGRRYLGLLREYEPDLAAILTHKQILILGEPGSGKSMAVQSIIQLPGTNPEAHRGAT
jgi:hypothetical protein